MSDVVFITPNFTGFVREEPVGTLLLATILKKAGISVEILQFCQFGNANLFDQFVSNAIQQIFDRKPKIVSFYTRCDSYHISLRIAEKVKAHCKDVYVVFAGPQADLAAEDTIREIPYVDFICCGEGENTIVPFFTSLISGKPDLSVDGLVYRCDGQVVKMPRPELIADLDSLPPIDYSMLEYKSEGETTKGKRLFPVDVGRGCPFSCTYCSTKTFWGRKYRLKSADRIIEEIKYIHDKFDVDTFNFEHDMFTMNREKVIHICEKLKNIGFPIHWRCSARMDCLDEELIDIMTDAGMQILFVGVESGSPRMQKLIHKNLKLDNIPEKLAYIAKKGVEITASFIYGFPEETEEDLAQTIELMTKICSLPKITVLPSLCAFLTGTELTNQYGNQLIRTDVYSLVAKGVAVKECEDIISAHPVLFPQYYEYKTPLREKAKYYPQFFSYWKKMYPVFDYIYHKYHEGGILEMLDGFTERNRKLLEQKASLLEIMKQDELLKPFSDDENYTVLNEVRRFLLWKCEAKPGETEIFGFDVKALIDGVGISSLAETVSIVTAHADENKIRFNVMQEV